MHKRINHAALACPQRQAGLGGARRALVALLAFGLIGAAGAQNVSDIRATVHNLSKNFIVSATYPTDTRNVKATSETEVCIFCHTPHNANANAKTPLWNRGGPTLQTYTPYKSSSLDATFDRDQLNGVTGGSSLLCLSCHDGVIALGNVNVRAGKAYAWNASPPTIALVNSANVAVTTMPVGRGVTSGYTRNLGTDLSNDHPISITYDDGLADVDKELARPGDHSALIGIRTQTNKPLLPLEPTGTNKAGQVQCGTCHDPHITKEKFLRLNRFQQNAAPTGNTFNPNNDIICLACHTKLGLTWANSVHANSTDAAYVYKNDAAAVRGFSNGKKVWEVACLNCHDTHTVSGSRRLLREGTGTAPVTASSLFQTGTAVTSPDLVNKASAIENTCYQCHNVSNNGAILGTSILTSSPLTAGTGVPDIKTEFDSLIHMPVRTLDQQGSYTIGGTLFTNANDKEAHDITDADFSESQASLGLGMPDNRHAECTDCHNPHRVIKNALFDGSNTIARRTHVPSATPLGDATAAAKGSFGNVASGALRGAWGVEPVFAAIGATTPWPQAPTGFTPKKGDPPLSPSFAKSQNYLTREYQLCFKCHSNYSNGELANNFPGLGNTKGGTPFNTNGMQRYTNVAAEFGSVKASDTAASSGDQGEWGESSSTGGNEDGTAIQPTGSYPGDLGNCTTSGQPCVTDSDTTNTYNHRSWHPVMYPTGRTRDERRMASTGGNFRAPFGSNVGTQTMHCSDCHGHSASWTQDTGPNLTKVQGPHGSDKNFLLKGDWSTSTSLSSTGVCGNCHNPTTGEKDPGNDSNALVSGFNSPDQEGGGGHGNSHDGKSCMKCHIAVPHGWKNKAFLVNLNCVGPEAGKVSCDAVSGYAGYNGNAAFSSAPYYQSAVLRVRTWRQSGNWEIGSCGMNGNNSRSWMRDSVNC